MNGISLAFSLVAASLLLALGRRWAPLPLLMAGLLIPLQGAIEIGPFHFSVVRVLIAVGFARVMMRGERVAGGWKRLDWVMLFWALGLVASGIFHENPSEAIVLRLGLAYDGLGLFILFRILLQEPEDIQGIARMICILLIPVAVGMLLEKATGRNYFALIFGGLTDVDLRNGNFRARGPFIHAIMAGTIGALCLPMALLLWLRERKLALVGLIAAGSIVVASGSSGPVMSALTVLAALAFWRFRTRLRAVRWMAVVLIVALHLVMNDPVWYLMARIDITGGSTGWHRARLISAGVEHLNEWWLVGTDYTRHWMPTGIEANENATDITNQYLAMGVLGGLPLLLLYVWTLAAAFSAVSQALRVSESEPVEYRFMIWTLGAILFCHAVTFLSISYFGHVQVLFYLLLACIGSLHAFRPASPQLDTGGVHAASEEFALERYQLC